MKYIYDHQDSHLSRLFYVEYKAGRIYRKNIAKFYKEFGKGFIPSREQEEIATKAYNDFYEKFYPIPF